MAKLVALIGLVYFVGVAVSGSVPFYKDVMKNFTKEELLIVDEFMSFPDKPVDAADFAVKFECGDSACNLCASLKVIKGENHEICIKEYNRKSKPSGRSALYVDGKQIQEFNVFNRYCQHFWGKVGGCLSVYSRAPEVGRTCYRMDLNLLFTLVTIDFNCVKHETETIKLDTSLVHKAGTGILDVDLFGGKRPQIVVQQKDKETVQLVHTAVKELLAKLE